MTVSGAVTSTAPPAVRIEPVGDGLPDAIGLVRRQELVDEHAQVWLPGEDLERLRRVARRDHDLEEDRCQGLGHRPIDLAREGHHTAERADRVGLQRPVQALRATTAARRHHTGWCA